MHHTNQYEIEIIFKKSLKHTYITIENAHKVTVKTPNKSTRYIESVLAQREEWIQKKLLQMQSKRVLPQENNYTLEYLQARVNYFATMMNLKYSQLKFRKMKRRWGSCNTAGVITLNKELCKLQKKEIDYVVVHELAHLVHMNHSKAFHQLVLHYLPEAEEIKKQLSEVLLV